MSAEAVKTAAVHDLGYKRYEGERRVQGTRYRVVARNVIAMAWRGWWRLKIWVISSALITVGGGVAMYLLRHRIVRALQRQGAPLPLADAVLPFTMNFYTSIAFVLSLTTAAGVIASDLRAGAFEFYFARALRPANYVVGKALGVAVALATAVLAGPLVLAVIRLGLTDSLTELPAQLELLPRAAAAGAVATAAYGLPALGFSALSSKRSHTMAAWAIFYVIVGQIAVVAAHVSEHPSLAALDIKTSVLTIANWLLEIDVVDAELPAVWVAGAVIAGLCAASLGFIYWRVSRAERAGLGGG